MVLILSQILFLTYFLFIHFISLNLHIIEVIFLCATLLLLYKKKKVHSTFMTNLCPTSDAIVARNVS